MVKLPRYSNLWKLIICKLFGCEPAWSTVERFIESTPQGRQNIVFCCIRCDRKQKWNKSKLLRDLQHNEYCDKDRDIQDCLDEIFILSKDKPQPLDNNFKP